MKDPIIFNVQKFSIHDGEGIRTTVFFKGCPLRCRWCHNPESQRFQPELMVYMDRCVHCGACAAVCPAGAISPEIVTDHALCTGCGACTEVCMYDARHLMGEAVDPDVLVERILRDAPFYEVSGGGITLSGGEPLAQDPQYLESLVRRLHRRGFRVNIDTCGHVPYANIQRILPYVDTFLYDLKHMDPQQHKTLTGVDNVLILENLRRLSEDGARIHIRMPLIAGLNDDEAEILSVIRFLQDLKIEAVSLLPYHKTGSDKYARIGRDVYADMAPPASDVLDTICGRLRDALHVPVKIGG